MIRALASAALLIALAPGRFTAQHDEPFVVYLLGMRINRLFAFSKWLLVARAIGR